MAYGRVKTKELVNFSNYQEAKQYYDNTKEIKGHDKYSDGVPLRNDRRDRSTSLRELVNGDMALRLHNTNIIIWHRPAQDLEKVTVNVSYNSMTTVNWANIYLPWGLRVHQRNGYTLLNDFYVCNGPMTFKKENNAWILISEPTRMVVERVDRAKAKLVREQSKEFYAYLHTMCAFEFTRETFDGLRAATEGYAKDLLKFSNIFTINSIRINFELTKRNYTEAKLREAGAYYWEELPVGTLRREMRVKR